MWEKKLAHALIHKNIYNIILRKTNVPPVTQW